MRVTHRCLYIRVAQQHLYDLKVVFVSRACPFPKPEWMSQDVYLHSLWDSLRASLVESLFFYLGFTLAGDREKMGQLTPLIELLPHTLPLGEKKDEPGTWLVLCA